MGLVWRRLRGVIGTSVLWAGGWAILGLLVGAGFWLSGEDFFGLVGPKWLEVWAEVGAITGALSGAAFSLLVIAAERRGDVNAITPVRLGIIGAATAGLMTAFIFDWSLVFGLFGGAIGLVSGAGSVIAARRALPASKPMEELPVPGRLTRG